MNNFVVLSCVYDGSSGTPDPLCYLHGSVNGVLTAYIGVYFSQIFQAFNSGGSDALKLIFAAILTNGLPNVPAPQPFLPTPVYSAPYTPAPAGNANNKSVSVLEALVGSWTA
jgi:hypothetical protein